MGNTRHLLWCLTLGLCFHDLEKLATRKEKEAVLRANSIPAEETSLLQNLEHPTPVEAPLETDVQTLVDMGFGRQEATTALKAAEGDVSQAAAWLFGD
jgi:Holliday junction resolvasome RuvABC DNA-binding subunit